MQYLFTLRLLKIPESECPYVWIRLPGHKWPKSSSNIEDPVALLERNLYGHPLAGLCGKDSSTKFFWNTVVRKFQIGTVCLFFEHKDCSYHETWMTSTWLERSRIWLPCERIRWQTLILTNQLHFMTVNIWDVVNVNANRMKLFLRNFQRCVNHVFLLEQLKNYQGGKSLTQGRWPGPTTWKDILRNASKDTASWQTTKCSSYTKFQVLAWMSITSNRKNLNQSENFHKYAHKKFWNVRTWHELEDQTFFGLSTNLQEQSQNGLMLATDVWQCWFRTFTTQVTTDNIVMWVTRLSIVDWVDFKTLTLLETLRTQNQLRGESDVSSEAEHLSPSIRYARKTNCCLAQFYRVWNHFIGCWIANGWTSCSRPLGQSNCSVTFNKQRWKTR